jgi:hypothetical protein
VLVARTDAVACKGLDAALSRASRYAGAGAAVLFVEAPRTREELAAVPAAVGVPCLVDVVEGGRNPQLPCDELEAICLTVTLYATPTPVCGWRPGVRRSIRVPFTEDSDESPAAELMNWEDRQALVRLPEW